MWPVMMEKDNLSDKLSKTQISLCLLGALAYRKQPLQKWALMFSY